MRYGTQKIRFNKPGIKIYVLTLSISFFFHFLHIFPFAFRRVVARNRINQ